MFFRTCNFCNCNCCGCAFDFSCFCESPFRQDCCPCRQRRNRNRCCF